MRILAIDTASSVVGIGLLADVEWTERTARVGRGTEALLVPWALELCGERGLALDGLDAIAVAAGPGGFTGLRVGLATAMGLAMSTGVPILTESSLATRADGVTERPLLTMLDARKRKVYAQYQDKAGKLARPGADVPPGVAIAWCAAGFVATGTGAVVYRSLIEAAGGRVAEDAEQPGLRWLAERGARRRALGEGLRPEEARPMYLRPPDARVSGKGRI